MKARPVSYFYRARLCSNTDMKLIALTLAVILAACSEPPAGTATKPESAPVAGERLLAQPPQGWKLTYSTDIANMSLSTYVPDDHDPDDWREKITIERVSGDPLDPIELLLGLADDQEATCDEFNHQNTFSGLENGYPTSVRIFVCNNNPLLKMGQVTLIKAIQGTEYSYIVTRSKRMPPFEGGNLPLSEEEMGGWSLYLRAIKACNPDQLEHQCPVQKQPDTSEASADLPA